MTRYKILVRKDVDYAMYGHLSFNSATGEHAIHSSVYPHLMDESTTTDHVLDASVKNANLYTLESVILVVEPALSDGVRFVEWKDSVGRWQLCEKCQKGIVDAIKDGNISKGSRLYYALGRHFLREIKNIETKQNKL